MVTGKRILAIETSGRFGSVATLVGDLNGASSLRQIALPETQRTAQSLALALQELLNATGWAARDVNLVAVAIGPGSFTGLRIGVTTAKAFAYAAETEIVAVDTLEAVAAQVPLAESPVWAILDAQRQELFAAKFETMEGTQLRRIGETLVISQSTWLERLQPGDRVTGPALKKLLPQLPPAVVVAPEDHWPPLADTVGKVAWRRYEAGQRDDLWKLSPLYLRPSAAEEKRPS
jgi:tRNA threonylcarbamoyladenosine biosynthesis protein TsaB